MITISPDTNTVEIQFNKQFYDLEIIKSTIQEFKKVCKAEIKDSEHYTVILKPNDKSLISLLGYEFCNYVLGSMKNQSKV